MRLAGTWNRYSSSATPQLTKAAISQGLSLSALRWAYHANVMNTLLQTSSPMESRIGFIGGHPHATKAAIIRLPVPARGTP